MAICAFASLHSDDRYNHSSTEVIINVAEDKDQKLEEKRPVLTEVHISQDLPSPQIKISNYQSFILR